MCVCVRHPSLSVSILMLLACPSLSAQSEAVGVPLAQSERVGVSLAQSEGVGVPLAEPECVGVPLAESKGVLAKRVYHNVDHIIE